MQNSKILKYSLINSLLVFGYVAFVSQLLTNGEKLFGPIKSVLAPTAFLLTFVFSVAIMGIIIFGRPILWYLDGFKKEAVRLIFYTLGFLLVILAFVFLTMVL